MDALHSTIEFATLVELLRRRALRQPEQRAMTFLVDGEDEEVYLTYGELDRQARAIGALLQRLDAAGERALLLYPPGLEYIAAFFGCLYAGAVTVPCYPPRLNRPDPRLEAVLLDSQAAAALTTTHVLADIERRFVHTPALEALQWLATDDLADGLAEEWREPAIESGTLAFLQYTSGSTAAPKGVMLTHGNLLYNSALIHRCFGHTSESRGVIWLPPYHDMGLIGGILQPVYGGFPVVLMSPVAFLQAPWRWLRAVSRYQATTSGGPNFAYDLCVDKIGPEQRAALDLSSWAVAFNGAEPVRPGTLERFAAAFGPCGFRRAAFYSCYGLAEATLIVAGGERTAQPVIHRFETATLERERAARVSTGQDDSRALVGCGQNLPGQQIVIVDPESLVPCSPERIGEIWLSGPSVAQGYWRRPEETQRTFGAHLADGGQGPLLRTGDLGFLRDGELFIAGRLKDLIIVRGRNHYPQDIELTVERSHPALQPGCGAAFSVDVEGEERLVVVQELKRTHRKAEVEQVAQAVRQAVAGAHELQVYAVVLVSPLSIPKTSSGKIQRYACRTQFLEGSLKVVGSNILDASVAEAPAGQPEESFIRKALAAVEEPGAQRALLTLYLQEQVARELGIESFRLEPQQPLSRVGLDSLKAVGLQYSIEKDLGIVLSAASFLEGPSVSHLASQALSEMALASATPPVSLAPAREEIVEYPLSFGQRSLWFLHQLASEQEKAGYNLACAVRIRGELDAPALRRAFETLVERHASLRTTFVTLHGEPVQHIHEQVETSFQEVDASTWSGAWLHHRLVEEAHRPFDLAQDAILRVSLFVRSARERVLLVTVHHLAIDFWSAVILVDEFRVLYSAGQSGAAAALPPSNLQYVDYVRWQNQALAGPAGERLWAYWQRQLGGELAVLNLPTDRPRPAVRTWRGAAHFFSLDEGLTGRIKALAQAEGATLYVMLLAAFQVLLHRYSAQEDIVVGSPAVGRSRAELEGVVGYFMNPIVLRADLSGEPAWQTFLKQVRRTVLDALRHQDYPSHLLSERLQTTRDVSHTSLFQVMFVLNRSHRPKAQWAAQLALGQPAGAIELAGLELEVYPLERRTAQFDLELSVVEVNESLAAVVQYNADLFDAATMARLAAHLQNLLESVVAGPGRRLSDLSLLAEAERHQLLVAWNDTGAFYPQTGCIHRLFEAQVAETPDIVAVAFPAAAGASSDSARCGDQHLTYSELNRRANRLARYLQELGVGPEVKAGVCVARSLEMIVGLLAVLKAGGAYVPLDPVYPSARLSFMLEDSRAQILVAQDGRLAEGLQAPHMRVVCLDAAWEDVARRGEENPVSEAATGNLAYVIYTSGSMGRPKGVAIQHHSLASYAQAASVEYGLKAGDRALQFASVSFDASAEEIYPSLIRGATLVLRTDSMIDTVEEFLQQCRRWAVTVLNLPTVYWHEITARLEAGRVAFPRRTRLVIIGGERAMPGQLASWQRRVGPEVELVNTYGPTEATIVATMCELSQRAGEDRGTQEAPIGRGVANVQVYVLDRYLRPAPVGVAGELYIGGDGLARGYLERPDATAERFIPHPFGGQEGARLYRTGDLARYLPDGNLEFLGRVDHQVKVRGFRIELGEVETVLAQHPAVQKTVVLAQADEPDDGPSFPSGADRRLVAYVVLRNQEATPSTGELRSFLKAKLPDYMVPSFFVALDALPTTASGKVDLRALPVPDRSGYGLEETFVAPRVPVEEVLAGIWADLLGLERVSVYDDFFELGGHSLLATQLTARVRETFQVELPLRDLFEEPTVAGLAERIEMARQTDELQLPPIRPAPRDEPLPLSFAQEAIWFLNQLEPNSASYHIPRAIRIEGALDVTLLARTFGELVRRHEILRTSFPGVNGRPVQVIRPPQPVAVPVVDLRALPESEREAQLRQLFVEEGQRTFDLAHDQLLRLCLLRLDAEEHVLILTEHHLVHDGWTQGVLMRDFLTIYRAYLDGQPSPLPELTVQYADYACWQRQWLQGEFLEKQLAFWRDELSGAPDVLELPTDRPRPAVQSFRGGEEETTLPNGLADSLRALSRREGVTLFMTMLAAFKALLYRYSRQDDVCVGSVIANRRRRETEELLGMILNTTVFRTDLSGNPTFRELLARVRETCLGVYAHQDLPFEKLVESIRPERSLSHNPLFQVLFAFQDTPTPELELPGLHLSLLHLHNRSAKFDLFMIVLPRAEQLVSHSSRATVGDEVAIMFEYNVDVFDHPTIVRLLKHYQSLLQSVVADPAQRLSDLTLLTEAERQQLLVEWNETEADYPRDRRIHELFAAQVERAPDAVALVFEEKQITYRELDRRANQLAHYLKTMGAGPEVFVGVCMDRSVEMVVGLLGILKAGGAYLSLDPAYPKERLAFMLQDSRIPILLTLKGLLAGLPVCEEVGVVCLDGDWQTIALEREENLPGHGLPESPLYAIYTSGSTGAPKGVLGLHRGAVNRFHWMWQTYPFAPTEICCQKTTLSFVDAVWEVWGPLLQGIRTVLISDEVSKTPRQLVATLADNHVTRIVVVPSLLRIVIETFDDLQAWLPDLKMWVTSGEALSEGLVQRFRERMPQGVLLNLYGSSEVAADATYYDTGADETLTRVSIGRPVANTRIYLLDGDLAPVPVGAPAELYVGGDGLARGYLNRPALTAARFIPSPFSDEAGARLYRTGDLARYLPDGNVEFLGRVDHQVKVRGFRIELAEVEAVLSQHPAAQTAAVLAREDVSGDKRLVAYVTPRQGQTLTMGDLHRFVGAKLPAYMLPSALVTLETLPLTPNGKVDRRALPAPDPVRPELEADFVAPCTPLEETLADIWAEILRVDRVGGRDNFFELGGHSLLATQLIARVRDTFQVDLPLRSLFETPTVVGLAQVIERNIESTTHFQAQRIVPVSREKYRGQLSTAGTVTQLKTPRGGESE